MDNYIVRKITQKRGDKVFHKYFTKSGVELFDDEYINNVKEGIYIPPNYNDVKINIRKKAKVRAIGYDDKQRPQYIYNKEFVDKQSKKKFNHMIEFGKQFKKINRIIKEDMLLSDNEKRKQIAVILKLIMECHFRVGSDKYYKENKSYGTTTLEKKHITDKGNSVVIDFIGKKKVRNVCTIRNKQMVQTLKRKKNKRSKSNRIFTYKYNKKEVSIKSKDVNEYLQKIGKFSTKNFRTWGANIEFIIQLLKLSDLPKINNQTEVKKTIKKAIDKVAFKLHNTCSVCRSNYLDPELLNYFTNDPEHFIGFFRGKKKNGYSKDMVQKKYVQFLESL